MTLRSTKKTLLISSLLALSVAGCSGDGDSKPNPPATATPVKHLVVIFQENVSFDHYFGTYPIAANLTGERPFVAVAGTPAVNNLLTPLDVQNNFVPLTGVNLLTHNPNAQNAANGSNAINPFRLSPAEALTADQSHDYTGEQKAFNNGAMDLFPSTVGNAEKIPS